MAFKIDQRYLHGDADTSLTLTGSYQASDPFFVGEATQVNLGIEYAMGTAESGNSIEVKLEFAYVDSAGSAPASTDYFQEITESASSGTITMSLAERTFSAVSAAGTFDRFDIPVPMGAKWIKVSVKETGIASNGGSCKVRAIFTVTD